MYTCVCVCVSECMHIELGAIHALQVFSIFVDDQNFLSSLLVAFVLRQVPGGLGKRSNRVTIN